MEMMQQAVIEIGFVAATALAAYWTTYGLFRALQTLKNLRAPQVRQSHQTREA